MKSIIISGSMDTVALEALILDLLKALKLDKNGDGKVSRAEIFTSLSELAPQFFNFNEAMAEARDLTTSEFNHLCNFAAANMPDFPNVRAEAETVVSASLNLVGSAAILVSAISRLNASKTPVEPPAEVKGGKSGGGK